MSILPGLDVGHQATQGGAVHVAAGEAAVVVVVGEGDPAFVILALDEGVAGFLLRVDGIEGLVQTFVAGDAGVDRAAPARDVRRGAHWPPALPSRRPKNLGPFHCVPVILRAAADRLLNSFRSTRTCLPASRSRGTRGRPIRGSGWCQASGASGFRGRPGQRRSRSSSAWHLLPPASCGSASPARRRPAPGSDTPGATPRRCGCGATAAAGRADPRAPKDRPSAGTATPRAAPSPCLGFCCRSSLKISVVETDA